MDLIDWNKHPRLVVLKSVSYIPKVGGIISSLLAEIWPEPKPDLIGESARRTKEWVNQRFITYDKRLIENEYNGLQKDIFEYINASNDTRRGSKFDICISQFDHLAEKLLNQESNVDPSDYMRSLDLFRLFATLHLGLLCERIKHPEAHGIDASNTDSRAFHQEKLVQTIKSYQSYVIDTAVPEILQWLDKQLVIEHLDGFAPQGQAPARFTDKTIITNQKEIDEDSKTEPEYFSEIVNHHTMATQRKEYIKNRMANILTEQVVDVAYAWSAFAPDADLPSFPKERQMWIGPVGVSLWNYQQAIPHASINHGYETNDGGGDIRQVITRHHSIVDFIMFRYGDELRRGEDVGNDHGGTYEKVKVPEGAHIVKVDTYWEYVCRGIQFFFSDGTESPILGMKGHPVDQTTKHEAHCPQGILTNVAPWGNKSGLSEIYFCFSQDNRVLESPAYINALTTS